MSTCKYQQIIHFYYKWTMPIYMAGFIEEWGQCWSKLPNVKSVIPDSVTMFIT